MSISEQQNGHFFVVGSGFGSFFLNFPRVTLLTPSLIFWFIFVAIVIPTKIENAIIKKSITADKKEPYFIVISL